MLRFILRRLIGAVPAVFAILVVTFLLVRMGGQSPVALLAGPTATREEIQMITAELGLDRPVWEQFVIYAGTIAGGDLGRSWISNRPVLADIMERLPVTLELLLWGVGIGAAVGIAIGLRAAWHRDGPFDQLARIISLVGFSVPTYFLALLALLVFFYMLEWAPPGMGRLSMLLTPPPRITGSFLIDGLIAGQGEVARSAFAQLVLPVLCIALIAAAPTVKQTRAIAIEVLGSDFVRYARAAGLPASRVRRIALRNCMVPVVTFIGSELTGLIGTTALIEYVFSWGGLGQYGLMQAGEKIHQVFSLEVTNKGGHSSRPVRDNAIYHLARATLKVEQLAFPLELTPVVHEYFRVTGPTLGGEIGAAMSAVAKDPNDQAALATLTNDPTYNAILHTTCAATQLDAGHAPNALPQRATAILSCRVMQGTTPEQVKETLEKAVADSQVKVEIVRRRSGSKAPELTDEVMKPVRAAAAKLWPGVPVAPSMTAGATDGRYLMSAGIPTYGMSGMFGVSGEGNAHGLNEKIRVTSLYEGREFLEHITRAYVK